MPFKYPNMRERIIANSFESTVSSYDGVPCRIWDGKMTLNRNGQYYGRITKRFQRGPRKGKVKTEFVHRVVVRDVKGRYLGKRMRALHLCNNTLCVEERHLVGGTQKRNVRQCVREGRHGNAYRAPVRGKVTA